MRFFLDLMGVMNNLTSLNSEYGTIRSIFFTGNRADCCLKQFEALLQT